MIFWEKNSDNVNFSHGKIIAILEDILEKNDFSQIHITNSYVGSEKFPGYSLSFNRLTYVAEGSWPLEVGSGTIHAIYRYKAGETLAMKPFVRVKEQGCVGCRCFSLVCYPSYMRLVYTDVLKEGSEEHPFQIFYHLQDSLRKITVDTVNLICNLQPGEEADKLGPPLMKILFSLLLSDMKNSKYSEFGKSNVLWYRILDFLSHAPFEKQNRAAIAAHFKVTESHVSRIFKQFSKMTFTEYIRMERLKTAVQLLNETDMTIDEIAWECNFKTTSYFIKLFRQTYNTTPNFYRRLKK